MRQGAVAWACGGPAGRGGRSGGGRLDGGLTSLQVRHEPQEETSQRCAAGLRHSTACLAAAGNTAGAAGPGARHQWGRASAGWSGGAVPAVVPGRSPAWLRAQGGPQRCRGHGGSDDEAPTRAQREGHGGVGGSPGAGCGGGALPGAHGGPARLWVLGAGASRCRGCGGRARCEVCAESSAAGHGAERRGVPGWGAEPRKVGGVGARSAPTPKGAGGWGKPSVLARRRRQLRLDEIHHRGVRQRRDIPQLPVLRHVT